MVDTMHPLSDHSNIAHQSNHIMLGDNHVHEFKTDRPSVCIGCGQTIFDRYILRVAPDLEWHAACLRCNHCEQYLDERCTAFVKDGKTYCKEDYVRLFSEKCCGCNMTFTRNDCVMRARHRTYHVQCFRCALCQRVLMPGDEFGMHHEGLYCRPHHDMLLAQSSQCSTADLIRQNLDGSDQLDIAGNVQQSLARSTVTPPCTLAMSRHMMPMPPQPLGHLHHNQQATTTHKSHRKDKKDKSKTTRVRTVLNEKQLQTLRQCYNANPRPDALMKEQLVEMTSLSPRVIRVWFQNKRCKDKKKHVAIKQMQQQQEKNHALQCVRQTGLGPLSAGSPSTHDGPSVGSNQSLDIHGLQQLPRNGGGATWQPLPPGSQNIMMMDSNEMGDCNDSRTPFQHLMHGFGGDQAETRQMATTYAGLVIDMDASVDMDGFSPHMISSDMSSPECSD